MKVISLHVTQGQLNFLKTYHTLDPSLDKLPISEHIRRAIDQYIEELKKKIPSTSSLSPSHG